MKKIDSFKAKYIELMDIHKGDVSTMDDWLDDLENLVSERFEVPFMIECEFCGALDTSDNSPPDLDAYICKECADNKRESLSQEISDMSEELKCLKKELKSYKEKK